MLNALRGKRPDLTPAHVVAILVSGVPIISNLLHVFGVFELSKEQQDALVQTMTWGGVLAGLLIGGDAIIRAARNSADAKVQSAALAVPGSPTDSTAAAILPGTGNVVEDDDDLDLDIADPLTEDDLAAEGLPSDEEEDAAPPPPTAVASP